MDHDPQPAAGGGGEYQTPGSRCCDHLTRPAPDGVNVRQGVQSAKRLRSKLDLRNRLPPLARTLAVHPAARLDLGSEATEALPRLDIATRIGSTIHDPGPEQRATLDHPNGAAMKGRGFLTLPDSPELDRHEAPPGSDSLPDRIR